MDEFKINLIPPSTALPVPPLPPKPPIHGNRRILQDDDDNDYEDESPPPYPGAPPVPPKPSNSVFSTISKPLPPSPGLPQTPPPQYSPPTTPSRPLLSPHTPRAPDSPPSYIPPDSPSTESAPDTPINKKKVRRSLFAAIPPSPSTTHLISSPSPPSKTDSAEVTAHNNIKMKFNNIIRILVTLLLKTCRPITKSVIKVKCTWNC